MKKLILTMCLLLLAGTANADWTDTAAGTRGGATFESEQVADNDYLKVILQTIGGDKDAVGDIDETDATDYMIKGPMYSNADCSGYADGEGEFCWDADGEVLKVYDETNTRLVTVGAIPNIVATDCTTISSPVEGEQCYRQDSNKLYNYTGVAGGWVDGQVGVITGVTELRWGGAGETGLDGTIVFAFSGGTATYSDNGAIDYATLTIQSVRGDYEYLNIQAVSDGTPNAPVNSWYGDAWGIDGSYAAGFSSGLSSTVNFVMAVPNEMDVTKDCYVVLDTFVSDSPGSTKKVNFSLQSRSVTETDRMGVGATGGAGFVTIGGSGMGYTALPASTDPYAAVNPGYVKQITLTVWPNTFVDGQTENFTLYRDVDGSNDDFGDAESSRPVKVTNIHLYFEVAD